MKLFILALASLFSSGAFAGVPELLCAEYMKPRIAKELKVNNGASYLTVSSGDAVTELFLKRGGIRKLIFSSKEIHLNIQDFSVSQNGENIAIALGKFEHRIGSPDDNLPTRILIARALTGQVISSFEARPFSYLFWLSNNEFLFNPVDKKLQTAVWDVKSQQITKSDITGFSTVDSDATGFLTVNEDLALLYKDGGLNQIAVNTGARFDVVLDTPGFVDLRGRFGNGEFVFSKSWENYELKLFNPKNATGPSPILQPFYQFPTQRFLRATKVLPNHVFALTHWGTDRWLTVINTQGLPVTEIKIPDCCSLKDAAWLEVGKKLKVTLSSAFVPQRDFVFNLRSGGFEDKNLERSMLTYGDTEMLTEVVSVKSSDGTIVPMRITHRKDLKQNGQNPTLIRVYGAALYPGYSDPAFDSMAARFIFKGGIFAGPALRGGNEFGQEWYDQGRGVKKMNTLQDLIAAERWMSASGWSSPERIITRGHSTGGFVVAAAALLAPEALSLVISSAGPYDLINDPNPFETGDPADPAERPVVEKMSPVELAKSAQSMPYLLSIVGANDTLVESKNAQEFQKNLLANPALNASQKAKFVWVPDAGHALQDDRNNGALYAESVLWGEIFARMK